MEVFPAVGKFGRKMLGNVAKILSLEERFRNSHRVSGGAVQGSLESSCAPSVLAACPDCPCRSGDYRQASGPEEKTVAARKCLILRPWEAERTSWEGLQGTSDGVYFSSKQPSAVTIYIYKDWKIDSISY